MQAAAIRRKFLDYFVARGHREVASSSLVPGDDPTLLFTNAGMVQFKRVFQGLERRDYQRAVTCQKCVRAGGKHNDLEQVGHTARHQTFFEMLGNFSFGDYFKQEAIEFAWEWVTSSEWMGIHPDRLYVTVHQADDETRRLWRKITGIADARIYGLGDKDNFWQMGDTGPCGPCSEILVDVRGERGKSGKAPTLQEFVAVSDEGGFLEIWNLVFMQYDQQPDASRIPLPAPSVDTGAGLERTASVLQGVPSNFDTDLFVPIIERAIEVVGKPYDGVREGAPFRVLADHARAVAFLLADGVYPASDGRGYVLRRILRRAVRHAWLLGRREPTLVHLAGTVIHTMAAVYPELAAKRVHIEQVTRAEEDRFLETIDGGLRRLDELKGDGATTISGHDAFKLYDTYGFPLDLTQMIAAERGQTVDVEGFERALAAQRHRSRAARKRGGTTGPLLKTKQAGDWVIVKPKGRQKWVGYETTRAETEPIAFRQEGERLELVLAENPFYAESGGQVSDTGVVRGEGWGLTIEEEVNQHIWENLPVRTREMKYKEAIDAGAMALFTEKYGDVVRVVDVSGVSLELCGGTHVPTTGQIALFRFTHETGAAANVRRIEAITGPTAYRYARELEDRLKQAASVLKTQPEHLTRRLEALLEQQRKHEKQIAELLKTTSGNVMPQQEYVLPGGAKLYYGPTPLEDRNQIAKSLDLFRERHSSAVSVIVCRSAGGRPGIYVALTDDLVAKGFSAGVLAQVISSSTGAKGGGRSHFASGGVGETTTVEDLVTQIPSLVSSVITS